MRYLVKARVRTGKEKALLEAIQNRTLGEGSVAGDEYLRNMEQARLVQDGTANWVEVCYCAEPLQEERPYWEKFFELVSIEDAHDRANCKHENGKQTWACNDCSCTRKLEQRLRFSGTAFLEELKKSAGGS
jgi:Uncharacterized conserved protein, contains Zn-ribbon-like motif